MDEVVEEVGHAQWVFTIPKMLQVYVLHHRELLGELSRAAAETAKELLAAAAGEEKGFRPGVVSVVQTFGDRANFHPHVHALVTRGGWDASGEWVPVPHSIIKRIFLSGGRPRQGLRRKLLYTGTLTRSPGLNFSALGASVCLIRLPRDATRGSMARLSASETPPVRRRTCLHRIRAR